MPEGSIIIYIKQGSLSTYYDLHGTMINYTKVCFDRTWDTFTTIAFRKGIEMIHKHLKHIIFNIDLEKELLLPKHIDYYACTYRKNVHIFMPKYLENVSIVDRTTTPYKFNLPKTMRYFQCVYSSNIVFKPSKNLYEYKTMGNNNHVELPKHIKIIHIDFDVKKLCLLQKITILDIRINDSHINCLKPIFPETLRDFTIRFVPLNCSQTQHVVLGKYIFDNLPCSVSRVNYSHNYKHSYDHGLKYDYTIDNFPNKLKHVQVSKNISCPYKT